MNDWRERATCARRPAEWWDLQPKGKAYTAENRRAIAICAECPVRAECHADALATSPRRRSCVILAGIPYGETGRPRPMSARPRRPWEAAS